MLTALKTLMRILKNKVKLAECELRNQRNIILIKKLQNIILIFIIQF